VLWEETSVPCSVFGPGRIGHWLRWRLVGLRRRLLRECVRGPGIGQFSSLKRRVGRGSCTLSLSQIRAGNSRFTRLVPLDEGCRLQYYQAHPVARWPGFLSSDPPPSLRGHYTASSLIRGSPPLTHASILSASCCCTCTFSLVIIGQVLKFRVGAWLRFTPPVRRSPPAR
jgi:hypothetical protein